MEAIFYFNDSGRLGRDGVGRRSKIRVGVGGSEKLFVNHLWELKC